MTPDSRAFRQTMGLLATGVTLIAARDDAGTHCMTANAVTSLSLDPLLVLACIARRAKMAEILAKAAGFSINILRDEQQALSTYFAGGRTETTRPPFRFVPWEGGPRLEGCAAAIGCALDQIVEGGDHWIAVGRVVALHQGVAPRRPLIFYAGRYARLDTRTSTPAPDLGWTDTPAQVFYDPWQEER